MEENMKFNKKVIRGGVSVLMMALSLAFVACSNDTEDDDDLEVSINADGNDASTSRKITISAPSNYDSQKVYIVYTLDGTDPDVSYDVKRYSASADIADYFDWGTAVYYNDAFSVSDSVTVKARGFYVKNNKAYTGPVTTKTVKVASSVQVDETVTETAPTTGNYDFKLASTGNALFTHYFDTSAGTLFKWGDNEHCYYQIQFSYTGAGKGNWYLYVRQVGNAATIKGADGNTNFVAKGTYTGTTFDNKKANEINNDTKLTLTNTVGDKTYEGTYTVTGNALTMKVSGNSSSAVSVGDAK